MSNNNMMYIKGRRSEMNNPLKFKGFCAENGIKQSDIAKLLGVTVSIVNAKINGRIPFTLSQVKAICEEYKISADDYFI